MRVVVACLLVGCVGCGRVDFDAVTDAPAAPLSVTKLEVYDHLTDVLIADVTNGAPADISAYPAGVAVIATVAGMPGSVELLRGDGARTVESEAPFASGGDTGNTDLKHDRVLVVGKTPMKVTAFELPNTGGLKGPTKAIDLELTLRLSGPPSIARVGIIDDDGTGFLEVADGAIVTVASLPTVADLKIETTPAFVGSVVIGGVGPWASRNFPENWKPYTAMGIGDSFTPTPGTYTITARAFTLGNGLGEGGATSSVTFQIVP